MKDQHIKPLPYDFERGARGLSSIMYLWPISKEEATSRLLAIWKTFE